MNRRQQPAPPRPPSQQQQQQRQQLQQQQQQQQQQRPASGKGQQGQQQQGGQQGQQQTYNPNLKLPAQVTIPQAISILVSRINHIETAQHTQSQSQQSTVVVQPDNKMEEMTARIVKLEFELLSAKDHIMKLQSFTLDMAKPSPVITPPTSVELAV
jgi:hypothetical protein